MTTNIFVCIKQVPDPEHFHKISFDAQTKTIVRSGIPLVSNPLDRHAMEVALCIKEQTGGEVTAITMGPPPARKVIEEAFALGADNGVLLCDSAFAGSDTLATAKILASGIAQTGNFDLILCGDESSDAGTKQVPAQIAEILNVPHVTSVKKVTFVDAQTVVVERRTGSDTLIIEVKLPALLAVTKEINAYRLPSIAGIMSAVNKPVTEFYADHCASPSCTQACSLGEIGHIGSPTRVFEIAALTRQNKARMFSGEPQIIAKELVKIIKEQGLL